MVAMKIAYTTSFVWKSFNVIYLFSERVYSVKRSNSSDIEIIAVVVEILKIKQYMSPLGEKVVPWDRKPARNISIHWKVHTFLWSFVSHLSGEFRNRQSGAWENPSPLL